MSTSDRYPGGLYEVTTEVICPNTIALWLIDGDLRQGTTAPLRRGQVRVTTSMTQTSPQDYGAVPAMVSQFTAETVPVIHIRCPAILPFTFYLLPALLWRGQFRQLQFPAVLFLRWFPDLQPKPSPSVKGRHC